MHQFGWKSLVGGLIVLAASFASSQQAPDQVKSTTSHPKYVATPTVVPDVTSNVTTTGGTLNYLPVFSGTSTIVNSEIYDSGTSVGIGDVPNPAAKLDINGEVIMRGSMQVSRSGNATASKGYPSYPFEFYSNVYNSSLKITQNPYFELESEPVGNNTATPSSTFNLLYVNGETGFYINPNGAIHFSPAQTFPIAAGPAGPQGPPGPAASVYTDDYTIFGDGSSDYPLQVDTDLTLDKLTAGYVHGTTTNSGAIAVQGTAGDKGYGLGGYGSTTNGYGVYANGNTAIFAEGVAWAGIFGSGNVYIGGTLENTSGSFKIDHPTDPENKYLSHSFVESPDMMNIYNGNVITDGSGTAIVTMPDWFESLNRDFRYQLTIIGQVFAQALVASEISNGSFTIKTDKPNIKVSWMVTGIRQDAWANAHRIPVEEEKSDAEKGHYLHPELYGHAGEPGIMDARAPQGVAAPR